MSYGLGFPHVTLLLSHHESDEEPKLMANKLHLSKMIVLLSVLQCVDYNQQDCVNGIMFHFSDKQFA